MNQRLTQIILLLTTIIFGLSFFTGCGKKTGTGSEPELTWATWTTNHSDYLDYNEQPFFKELQKQTGVKIKFKFDVIGEAFNLLIASGDLPDIIQYNWYLRPGGPEKQINDGIIIDLTDAINKWAPNLRAYLDKHPDIDRDIKTDSGKYYCFPFIRGDEYLTVFEGPMVRKDLLDKYRLEIPETIAEWENVLKVFKENGIKSPLSLTTEFSRGFYSAYNVTEDYYLDNGKIKFGPIENGWKEFLQLFNKWYKEGLLDSDYGTVDKAILNSKISSGNAAAAGGLAGSTMGVCITAGKELNEKFELIGAKYPVLNKGDYPEFGQKDLLYNPNSGAAITSQCKNIELAAKVLDFAYGAEGHMLYNFGIAGESYEMIDGYPKYTDVITNYENGDITASLKRYVVSVDHAPCIQDVRMYEQRLIYAEQKEAIRVWSQTNMAKHVLPHITYTPEETEIINEVDENIKTYVSENTMKFILGQKSFDEWNSYVETIRSLGIDKIIAIKETALERYNNR